MFKTLYFTFWKFSDISVPICSNLLWMSFPILSKSCPKLLKKFVIDSFASSIMLFTFSTKSSHQLSNIGSEFKHTFISFNATGTFSSKLFIKARTSLSSKCSS